ncbi:MULTISPECIES: peptidoglycan-associated lipoprotein Pal [Legionella]|uniref:Peptidoglycan-associated lipoprotein n=1 Tax=Legionella septentrionalis TaxID=2498109 RepID=A0A433JLE3_9GAMM|nr:MULTISPECIES: peptidoglycan-associated lipoprotein Pal [Legionella]MCP0914617.1 peptidoglycan-associated lipoprotein Pal [Legionella sp. 27cVA30]RUQ90069.1 peptidoglycan-associated lipoprotein Pal [Legionella septentrionalis]RUQ96161.1 peptidoglycan-associated lipoprotein Pal [Legionella septentrionalis]RUR09361.1 peptidoglycan-associated lipoprotein Pal [Legionella septentrionalis]RUR14311.1 peptidoglycan-associated lipoprotein Pal [Legionella septentrionalis]
MNIRTMIKLGFLAASILLASCSKTPGSADGIPDDGDMSARGLGQLNSRFAGQEQGEIYTTQAPHNQIYLFNYDDSNLAAKYVPSVNAQAEYLKSHPGARILIAGHTDERGSREYNVALGERRANTVAQLMRMAGVSPQQMRVVSYGKERPVYFGHDEASHRQNRRVELTYEATR